MVLTITVEFADFCPLRRIERLSSEQRHQRNCKESSCVFDLHREKAAPDAYFEQRASPEPTYTGLPCNAIFVKHCGTLLF